MVKLFKEKHPSLGLKLHMVRATHESDPSLVGLVAQLYASAARRIEYIIANDTDYALMCHQVSPPPP